MRYLILADIKSLWRQFAWVFYLCAAAMILSLGFLVFTYATGMKLASDENAMEQEQKTEQAREASLDMAIFGDCPTEWPSTWAVHSKESTGEVDVAVRRNRASVGINCANGNAELVVEQSESFTVIARSGALALRAGEQTVPLQNVRPPKSESGESTNTLMFWGMAVFFVFFPVKIASSLVFEEKNSGRLEWLLGNGVRPHEYLSGKAASLSFSVVSTITLLIVTMMIVFMAVIVMAIQSDPQIAFLFEDVIRRTEGASTPMDIVLSVGASVVPQILGFLVSSLLLASLLVVIATGVYLTVFSQVRTVALLEMGMLMTLFLLPAVLEDPSVLWWFPITATFTALESAITLGESAVSIMDLIVPQLVWLGASIAIVGAMVTRRMHWSHC